jgi:asparagine synthase (glutamine-hydrolysing)
MIKGKIPEQILNRPKQAYRAPIGNLFNSDETPSEIKELLKQSQLESAGIFDSTKVNQLLIKLDSQKRVSEMDYMAITAIVSVQILHKLFVKKSFPQLQRESLLELDKVILDY